MRRKKQALNIRNLKTIYNDQEVFAGFKAICQPLKCP